MESFNGELRDELLNRKIFYTLAEAKIWVERWRREYDTLRPHSSLGYRARALAASRCHGASPRAGARAPPGVEYPPGSSLRDLIGPQNPRSFLLAAAGSILEETWKKRGYDADCSFDCESCMDEAVCDDMRQVIVASRKKERVK